MPKTIALSKKAQRSLETEIGELALFSEKFKNEKKLTKDLFTHLVTVRNRNLISENEQNILQNTVVAFFGLSVGSHAATAWLLQSRADKLFIFDPDEISFTNLNRLTYSVSKVGEKKTQVLEELLHNINPFCDIKSCNDTSMSKIEQVFERNKIDAIVDEIDDIEAKVYLRQLARKFRLPLISAADIDNTVYLSIERHDKDTSYPFFHGDVDENELQNIENLTNEEKRKLIIKIVGFDHNSERLLKSLMEIGKSLPTWPQLGTTALMAGSIVATAIKKIKTQSTLNSGKYYIDLDEILDNSKQNK